MAPAGELQGLRDFFTDPKKTGHVCLLGRRTIALRSWTRWITVAVRVCVLVFLPYVLGVSGLTTVPPSSSGLRNENPLLASARAFGVSSTVLAAQSADTGIVRLSPQDTYLNLDPTNHAQQPTVRVYTWPDHRPANAAVLKFDFSSIPRDAIVQRATLRLSLTDADPTADATYTISAHKILRKNVVVAQANGFTSDGRTGWTPSACCVNDIPLGQADLGSPEDVRAIDKTLGFKSWTVTEMVREWLASPSTNHGVMLNADATNSIDRYRYFASMEHSNASLRPYLEIAFAAADATPPSVAVTAPVGGTTLSDAVTISADASDQGGVAGVRFQLNGAPFGAELTSAPYTTTLDTTTLSDGTLVLTAEARDWDGNVARSPGVSVTIRNGLLYLPPDDTFLNLNRNNYSNEPILATYTWPNNKIANTILMKFDLSALPNGALLQEATLHLALVESDPAPEPTYTVTAHKVVGRNPIIASANGYTFDGVTGWTPSACCFEGTPLAQGNISGAYAQRAVDKVPARKIWTITRMVEEWLANPASNFGLLLNSDATKLADRWRYFASMQHPDATLRPYLRVRFVPPAVADTTPPSVSITTPTTGASVSGTVAINAAASDNVGVSSVQFQADGVDIGVQATAAPFSITLNTATLSDGSHSLRAIASDAAGNSKISSAVTVNVSNDTTPPSVSITAPAKGAIVQGTINVTAAARDNKGVTSVQFQVDGTNAGAPDTAAPFATSWQTTTMSNGSHVLRAIARDAAGNTQTSAGVTVTVANDVTAPSVSITAPNSGATVLNTVAINAAASDNVGVTSVEFQIDGANVGAPDTSAPYSVSWNTTTVANGGHTVAAIARDAAGNSRTSAVVTVTVSNPIALPPSGSGIAAQYPGDVGIEKDSRVVFVERFDESSLSTLFGRWTDVLNATAMSFSTDVPAGSPLRNSLAITSSSSSVGGHLYKQITPGVNDTLYVRYYIKFPAGGSYSHDGIWMGGYNPALAWPNPQAGVLPTGTDRFAAAAEQAPSTLTFDHYDYWMGMHRSLDGNYWGNTLLNNPSVLGNAGQWMCVEHMVKLNNPVTSSNGEHAIWLNGIKISHLGQGFPKGTWSGGKFIQSSSGSPFPGFQWRSDPSLNLNYIWLQNYAPNSTGTQNMMFAHVVAAMTYIGCLSGAAPPPPSDTTTPTVSVSSPSGGAIVSGTVAVSAAASDNVGVVGVQFKLDGVTLGAEDTAAPFSATWNTTSITNGSHVLTAVARDAAGNTNTSTSVSVSVANATAPAALAAGGWPNEPAGFTTLTDWAFDESPPTSGDVPIPGTNGWKVVYNVEPGSRLGGWVTRTSDSSAPFSASNVYDFVYPAGMVEGTAPATVYYYGINKREVYAGFWWKPSSPFDPGPAGNKIAFLFNGGGGAGGQQFIGLAANGQLIVLPEYQNKGFYVHYPNVNATKVTLGVWHRVEWYTNLDTGVLKWWLDGVLQGSYTDVVNTYPFDMFQFSPTFGGCCSARKAQTDHYWFDHAHISAR